MNRILIHPHDPPAIRPIKIAADAIHRGAIAAYPTDTVYALGCAIDAKKSAEALYRLKGMPKSQRMALICPDLSTAALYGHFSQTAFKLCQQIFPGPYTVVVPATRLVPKIFMDKRRRTIGIRIVNHPVTRAIVQELGRPLLTTSAVSIDSVTCIQADEVAEHFSDGLDLFVDSGSTPGQVSTVLQVEGEEVEILREGLGATDHLF